MRKPEFSSKILEKYEVGEELGAGSFSRVFLASEKSSGKNLALKRIDPQSAKENNAKSVSHEINMQKYAGRECENVVTCWEIIIEEGVFNVFIDLYRGGDLVDGINALANNGGKIKDAQAAYITKQMMTAIAHLHGLTMVHRDVKVENFVADRRNIADPDLRVALADFGFAKMLENGQPFKEKVGTREYWAPEVLEGKTGYMADVWAVGVSAFVLLCWRLPFGESDEEIFRVISDPKGLKVIYDTWTMSHLCQQFLDQIFVQDPAKRLSAKRALMQKWLTDTPERRREHDGGCGVAVLKTLGNVMCCACFGGNRNPDLLPAYLKKSKRNISSEPSRSSNKSIRT